MHRWMFVVVLATTPALAQEGRPEWAGRAPSLELETAYGRAFVASGRSSEYGGEQDRTTQAEDDAYGKLGQLVADWQEAALRCANEGTDATQDPQPVYGDGAPKPNKHPKHHTENGYGCQVCHWPTTTTGNTITSRTLHANGSVKA